MKPVWNPLRAAQVDPPDADALLAGEPDGLIYVILETRQPVGPGLGIVGGEAVDVLGREAGTRERRKDPREVRRRRVREP